MSAAVVPLTHANLQVHFACNDPDSGNFAGSFEMVEFHETDCELTLEGDELPINFRDGVVTVLGFDFPHSGRNYWVGNWCWDCVHMSVGNARILARRLLEHGWRTTEWATNGPLSALVEAHG